MGVCSHRYDHDDDRRCALPATDGSAHCIWHNPRVRRTDPYVALVLARLLPDLDDLDGFKLAGLRWPKATLAGLHMVEIDLRDALLPGADLHASRLTNAILRRATLVDADLHDTDLSGADLTMVNLHGANLRGANLTGCILTGANLRGADLRDVELDGAVLDNFAWNRNTRFSGITGFDPNSDATIDGDDEDTQIYAAPLALASHHSAQMPSGIWNPEWERTHMYHSGTGERDALERAAPDQALAALQASDLRDDDSSSHRETRPETDNEATVSQAPPAPPAQAKRTVFRPGTSYHALLAASILVAMIACGFILVMKDRVEEANERVHHLNLELAQARTTPTQPEQAVDVDQQALEQRIEQQDRQHQRMVDELAQLREVRRQLETRVATLENDNAERRLSLARLQARDDMVQEIRDQHAQLEQDRSALVLQNQRLHDTARILNQGIAALQKERDELAAFKQKHVNDYYNYTRLQGEVDSLRKDNQALISRNKNMGLINESLQQRLQEAEQSLNTFLAHLEGSRLKEYLNRGADEDETTIPVEAGKPVIFGGEYMLTVRVDPAAEAGKIRTRLVVQRPANKLMPDINLLLYDQSGKALRSLAISFPENNENEHFATIDTTLSCSIFPSSIRVLVNPALDPNLLANGNP